MCSFHHLAECYAETWLWWLLMGITNGLSLINAMSTRARSRKAWIKIEVSLQHEMHVCAAKCCEDQKASIDTVQGCIERCSMPVNRAQRYISSELEGFQGRLQRCVMVGFRFASAIATNLIRLIFSLSVSVFQQCNDDVKVQMPPEPTESEIAKYTSQFERCAIKCVDKQIDLIPQLFKTMKTVLSNPKNIPKA